MNPLKKLGQVLAAMAVMPCVAAAPAIQAVVQADQPGHAIPKTLYGLFFEDINYAADGGLYAELIANRGFDWPVPDLQAWEKDYRGGGMARLSQPSGHPVHPNTARYLRIEVFHPGKENAGVGVANAGFGGIAVKQGATYDLSFYARPHRGYTGGLTVALESKTGTVLTTFRLDAKDWRNRQPTAKNRSPLDPDALADWVKYTAELVPTATLADARLVVLCDAPGTVDLDFISLFPRDTYGKRKNGLRADLVNWLREMKPGSLRFPGGCIVEGVDMDDMYDWKRTVGPVERRAVNRNLWGYWQSGGLGFFEYFQLAEDIGAAPVPVLAAGMSCQSRKPVMAPLDGLDKFIQDALDLIEFANGAPDTPWGKVRAEMGHPAPFGLKMLGIGNENWTQDFLDRYAAIAKAIKAKHPEIELISSSGVHTSGEMYDLAWKQTPADGADWIDEHYYSSPEWMFNSVGRYDKFDRKGPKVYVGEYACHMPDRANSLDAALAEAFLMTGFERNSDIVGMTAYAPLFNKIGHSQWVPDMIWFDNTRSFATPSYHVQKLFMHHLPDILLPTTTTTGADTNPPSGRIGLHTWNTSAEFRDIRVTRGSETLYAWNPSRKLDGWSKPAEGTWEVAAGVLRQLDSNKTVTAISVGDASWQNYTIRLKARKTGGAEGFIIRLRDQGKRHVQVNFGGWKNTAHGIEQNSPNNPLVQSPGTIETNRWYDVEITLQGDRVSAKLDGKTLFDRVAVPVTADASPGVALVSGYDKQAGEIIVKCVNPVAEARSLQLKLAGADVPAQRARRITLTGTGSETNDLDHPNRVSPAADVFAVSGSAVKLDLKPSSLTILRVKARLK